MSPVKIQRRVKAYDRCKPGYRKYDHALGASGFTGELQHGGGALGARASGRLRHCKAANNTLIDSLKDSAKLTSCHDRDPLSVRRPRDCRSSKSTR